MICRSNFSQGPYSNIIHTLDLSNFHILRICPMPPFWPRAMLKGPKRSFVVVVVVVRVGGESWAKLVPNRTKNVQGNKKFHKGFFVTLWYWMALNGLVWPFIALYGLARPIFFIWRHMVLYRLFIVFYGKISISLDLYRLFSQSWIQIHLVLLYIEKYFSSIILQHCNSVTFQMTDEAEN